MKKERENSMGEILRQKSPEDAPKTQDVINSEPEKKFYRPSRAGKKAITIHLDPNIAKQLKIMAVENDTSLQKLIEESVELLFVKKGKDLK